MIVGIAGALSLAAVGWAVRSRAATDHDAVLVTVARDTGGPARSISIATVAARREAAAAAADDALDELDALARRLGSWDPASEMAAVNRGAGGPPVPVSAEARAVIGVALAWAETSGGAFDPTRGALYARWERARSERVVPAPEELDAARRAGDWRAVALGDDNVTLPAGRQLDLGGVLEGWLVARASAQLTARGFPDHLVDGGGDLAIGGQRGGRPWRIAIADPRRDGARFTIDAPPGEVATSGDYRRFVEIDGVRYAHIIDPRTGWPARGVASVTVIARRDADPLATALFVLGVDAGLALVASLPGVEALFITADGGVRVSRGLRLRGRHVEVVR